MRGQRLGDYDLVEEIGRGGMGTVFRGIHRTTRQPVAIKQLKPELLINSPEILERFVREGEALRSLNHPNIINMLDALTHDQHHYLVMEYAGDGSLYDLLKREIRLPVPRVLDIALDLSDALTRAH